MDSQMTLVRINERAGHLLNTGQWTDCTFIVGTENSHEVSIIMVLFIK